MSRTLSRRVRKFSSEENEEKGRDTFSRSVHACQLTGFAETDIMCGSIQPTVLTDVQRCEIDEDETFGPVAALYRFKTEEEVIKRANEPRVGLAG